MTRSPQEHPNTQSFLSTTELAQLRSRWAELADRQHKNDLQEGVIDCRTVEEYDDDHHIDFFKDVIPRAIQRAQRAGRRAKLLDSGAGVGFFNDLVREEFGEDICVIGTNLSASHMEARRIQLLEAIRAEPDDSYFRPGLVYMKDTTKIKTLRNSMNPDDVKYHSVLEMSKQPEFDIIIDEFGELYYAFLHYSMDPKPDDLEHIHAERVLDATLRKLSSGGELFVSDRHKKLFAKLWSEGAQIEQQYGVNVSFGGIPRQYIFQDILKGVQNPTDPEKGPFAVRSRIDRPFHHSVVIAKQ